MDKAQIYNLLATEPIKIGVWCGFRDLGELHNKWLKAFLYGKEDMTLQGHRGSYKTTVVSLFLALNHVLRPNQNTMFFRKTDADVGEVMRQTAAILESSVMRQIVLTLWDKDLKLTKRTDSELSTSIKATARGASPIIGLGINTSITGKHADIIVTDDIVNVNDRTSRAERERTKRQYMELQNVKNRGGRFINTGTPWHKEDAFMLMPNIHKFDCYSTGMMTKEQIQQTRSKMTDSLFAANYELKHIADEQALFREPKYTSNVESIHNGRAHIDAAYGGEDWTAYTIMKQTENGFVGFGKVWHKHVDECLGEIEVLHKYYHAGSISCETNGDKGYLAKELREKKFVVHPYPEHMNKYIKIASHLKSAWDNIEWLDDTDPEYMIQILDYTENAEHDDAPDSAASLIRQYEKNPTITPKIKPRAFR